MIGLTVTKPYELDIFSLAPQVASRQGELGRTVKSILKEVLNEYLNAERESGQQRTQAPARTLRQKATVLHRAPSNAR